MLLPPAVKIVCRFALLCLCGVSFAVRPIYSAQTNQAAVTSHYETRASHDPNGIGKYYVGREIARVMGHEAADWLERPTREQEERTDLLLPALRLKAADVRHGIACFQHERGQQQVSAFLLLASRALQPIRRLVPHDACNLALPVKLADAIWIVSRASFIIRD